MKDWMKFALGLLLIAVVGFLGLLLIVGLFFNPMRQTPATSYTTTEVQNAPADQTALEPAAPYVSLNYDETGDDPLPPGQSRLIASYLRIPAPISQASLEAAISKIKQEATEVKATTFQGSTLTLDQGQAWLVWCSDARQVDPPADVSLVHEVTLLSKDTVGRIWIQVPFAQGVPLRTDNAWTKCTGEFWAVAVH